MSQLETMALVVAALAGAALAVVVVDGPLWLVLPGALGALLPGSLHRWQWRRHD